jgi:hypothetical protein
MLPKALKVSTSKHRAEQSPSFGRLGTLRGHFLGICILIINSDQLVIFTIIVTDVAAPTIPTFKFLAESAMKRLLAGLQKPQSNAKIV